MFRKRTGVNMKETESTFMIQIINLNFINCEVSLFCSEEKLLNSLKRSVKYLGGFDAKHGLGEYLSELVLLWVFI